MAKQVEIKELLDAGVHFGHLTRKWNPNMAPYIFMERNGVHILDLNKSRAKLRFTMRGYKNSTKHWLRYCMSFPLLFRCSLLQLRDSGFFSSYLVRRLQRELPISRALVWDLLRFFFASFFWSEFPEDSVHFIPRFHLCARSITRQQSEATLPSER